MPSPPPTSTTAGAQASSVRQTATKPASQSSSMRGAARSSSWEPRWMCSPAISTPSEEPRRTASIVCSGRQAELGAEVSGLDRLVRVHLDARRDPDERPLDPGRGRSLDLVRRVENEVEHVGLGGRAQLLVALVVAVDNDLSAVDSRPGSDLELAQRRDVGADPLLGEEAAARPRSGRPCCRRRRARSAPPGGRREPGPCSVCSQ